MVQTAETFEGMRFGVVHLGWKGLTDTKGLCTASAEKYLSRLQYDGKTEIMIVDHLNYMPFSILEKLCCWCRHKAISMASCHDKFAIGIE